MLNTANFVVKNSDKSIICLSGPTAVGKTGVAIDLAQALDTEILSFDSRQFYREIPIGTAAPTPSELEIVKHHFILDRSIQQELNAADFAEEALKQINELHRKYDQLVLVGGSGLYLKALVEGFDEMPDVEEGMREKLNEELATKGIEALQKELAEKDPQYYAQVDINNPQRLIRALELIRSSGQKFSAMRKSKVRELPFTVRKIALNMDRQELYQRINSRVDIMVDQGLLEEVKRMIPHQKLNALQTVGYKELFPYFAGNCNLDFALDEIRKNSRRYAKRQLTWFRRVKHMEWFHPRDWQKILNAK